MIDFTSLRVLYSFCSLADKTFHFVKTLWSFWRLFTVFVRQDQTRYRLLLPSEGGSALLRSLWAMSWVLPGFQPCWWQHELFPPLCELQELLYLFLSGGSPLSFRSFLHMHAWSVLTWRFERNSVDLWDILSVQSVCCYTAVSSTSDLPELSNWILTWGDCQAIWVLPLSSVPWNLFSQ